MNYVDRIDQNQAEIKKQIEFLTDICHGAAAESGWWTDMKSGHSTRSPLYGIHGDRDSLKINVPEKLMLVVSELGEAMEGFRKNKRDEHLPHRLNIEVEIADAIIRLLDLGGGIGLDVGGAVAEKLAYNMQRADHKMENRAKDGGKAF